MEPQNNPNYPQDNQPQQPNSPGFSPQPQALPQYPQPQQSTGYPQQPIQQQPAPQYGQPVSINPTPPNYGTNTSSHNKSHKKLIVLILVVLAIVIGGAIFAFAKHNKNNTGVALSCTPLAGSTVNATATETEYKTFANAIKQKDQQCVNALSSTYFEQYQDKIFSVSNGDWITTSQGGSPSTTSRLSELPATFTASSFTNTSYTRASSNGQSVSNASTGTTLSYPITDSYSKSKVDMEISFVSENNKIVVDFFQLVPAALNQNLQSAPLPTP